MLSALQFSVYFASPHFGQVQVRTKTLRELLWIHNLLRNRFAKDGGDRYNLLLTHKCIYSPHVATCVFKYEYKLGLLDWSF